jgi:hypothetical protein
MTPDEPTCSRCGGTDSVAVRRDLSAQPTCRACYLEWLRVQAVSEALPRSQIGGAGVIVP